MKILLPEALPGPAYLKTPTPFLLCLGQKLAPQLPVCSIFEYRRDVKNKGARIVSGREAHEDHHGLEAIF